MNGVGRDLSFGLPAGPCNGGRIPDSCPVLFDIVGAWRSYEVLVFATLEWIDWFSNRRVLEPIGNIPPAEAGANHYAALDQPAMAA